MKLGQSISSKVLGTQQFGSFLYILEQKNFKVSAFHLANHSAVWMPKISLSQNFSSMVQNFTGSTPFEKLTMDKTYLMTGGINEKGRRTMLFFPYDEENEDILFNKSIRFKFSYEVRAVKAIRYQGQNYFCAIEQ